MMRYHALKGASAIGCFAQKAASAFWEITCMGAHTIAKCYTAQEPLVTSLSSLAKVFKTGADALKNETGRRN